VSTRKRIARTVVTVLTILGLGSIGSAGLLGHSTVGPAKAFASIPETQSGALGVGERTIAPLAEPAVVAEKVDVEQSVSATAAAAVAAPAVKRVSTKADYARAARASTAKRMTTAQSLSSRSVRGWLQARCSWYGPGFYGNTMAGGGRLQRNSMVVAHKRLPFGTRIQFWHRGKSVIAVVRDRGPYVSGRAFDLGPGTAKALGFGGVGVLRYRILGKTTKRTAG
jgi:rare lipoprotein A